MNKSAAIEAVSRAYGKPIRQSATSWVAYVPYDSLDGPTTELRANSYSQMQLMLVCRKAVSALVLMGHMPNDVDYLVYCDHQFRSDFRSMVGKIHDYLKRHSV